MIDSAPSTTVTDYTKFAAIGYVDLVRTRQIVTANSIRRDQLATSGMQRQFGPLDAVGRTPQPMLP